MFEKIAHCSIMKLNEVSMTKYVKKFLIYNVITEIR